MDFISNVLKELLNILFGFTGDLGIAIVVVTLLIKVLLTPLSINQKISASKQQELSEKFSQLKEKYKNNPKELEKHMSKYSSEGIKSMIGIFLILLQMPIVCSLYKIFLGIKTTSATVLIPWVSNLSISDSLFLIPCIYVATMLIPHLINLIPYFKAKSKVNFNITMLIPTIAMGFLLTFKTPVAIGLYLITSSIYSVIEDILFKVFFTKKLNLQIN